MSSDYELALRDALSDCLIALGHVGVKLNYERTHDLEANKLMILLELNNPGGLNGICQRAFEKAQKLLQAELKE